MMKKILIFVLLLCTLLITSCAKQFKCQIDYQVVYSDTTYVRSYVFDGNERASYEIVDNGKHGKFLIIYPIGTLGDIIARVPNRSDNIIVTDFKTFRYDIDIPYCASEK